MVLPEFRHRVEPGTARGRSGKVHPILLWLLGVPIPVIILLLLLRGCTGWP